MSNSAITTQVAQLKIGSVQNQADSSAVYSAGVWSFKNSTALTSVTITDSGNVGIGTASPSFANGGGLEINGKAGTARLAIKNDATGSATGDGFQIAVDTAGDVYIEQRENKPLIFSTNLTEKMRIDASGNLLVGQNSTVNPPTSAADIYAGGLFLNPNRRTAANAASAYWEAATGVFYRSTSSLRYKTDVQDYDKGLSIVLNLRPVSFKPKEGDKKDRIYAGFIAEEIDSLGLNEFVEYDADGLPDSVGYAQITALLTKAIQELSAKVDAQAAEIEALKAKP